MHRFVASAYDTIRIRPMQSAQERFACGGLLHPASTRKPSIIRQRLTRHRWGDTLQYILQGFEPANEQHAGKAGNDNGA